MICGSKDRKGASTVYALCTIHYALHGAFLTTESVHGALHRLRPAGWLAGWLRELVSNIGQQLLLRSSSSPPAIIRHVWARRSYRCVCSRAVGEKIAGSFLVCSFGTHLFARSLPASTPHLSPAPLPNPFALRARALEELATAGGCCHTAVAQTQVKEPAAIGARWGAALNAIQLVLLNCSHANLTSHG